MPTKTTTPERRRRDENAALWLASLALLISMVFAVTTRITRNDFLELKDARSVGVVANCSIQVGIITAGRDAIPAVLTLALGDQALDERATAKLGDKYEQTIARAVRRALREAGESQVPLTGDRLDCEKLQDLLQP